MYNFEEYSFEEDNPETGSVCRCDTLRGDELASGSKPRRERYYIETPSSKDDMVRGVLFDMSITCLELGRRGRRANIMYLANRIEASYSFLYEKVDASSHSNIRCRCYEWKGDLCGAGGRSEQGIEETKQVIDEYSQLNGDNVILVDWHRDNTEIEYELIDMLGALKKTRDLDRIESLIFDTLDGLGLRRYESDGPAERRSCSGRAMSNRWKRESMKKTATNVARIIPQVPGVLAEGAKDYIDERRHMRELRWK